ncbi:MAG TPA: acetyl-CoA carboxylase biotin carboxylase subunit family protein [Cyclobacteriaceae bacterium]
MKKQVFVIGLDEFNLNKLQKLPGSDDINFLPALKISEMRQVENFNMENLINLCIERIDQHGHIDAIVSYYDFPGTTILPIIAAKYSLPGPTLESVMKCENKYWSRLEQSKIIGEHIPMFRAFDPFDKEAFEKLGMIMPFWIKPIKSFRSFLAYKINGQAQFLECMEEVKKHIDFISEPFNYVMKNYNLPEEFASMEETCIAESPISGHQCTVEGYSYKGNVIVYGIVDSIREEDRSSFGRYEYPSSLPQEIQFRMADVTRRIITQLGLDNSPFNIEYFYNQTADEVYLLEINPRISQAHTDIFEKVHGISHHYVMLSLALGQKPKTLENKGQFNKAANFMLRTFETGKVKKAPKEDEIKILKKFIPGLEIKIQVKDGMHLSDLQGQDSYSYELANIFIGGRDQMELVDKYHQCIDGLTFDIEYDESVPLY